MPCRWCLLSFYFTYAGPCTSKSMPRHSSNSNLPMARAIDELIKQSSATEVQVQYIGVYRYLRIMYCLCKATADFGTHSLSALLRRCKLLQFMHSP